VKSKASGPLFQLDWKEEECENENLFGQTCCYTLTSLKRFNAFVNTSLIHIIASQRASSLRLPREIGRLR